MFHDETLNLHFTPVELDFYFAILRVHKIDSPCARSFCTLREMKSMTGYGRGERAQDGFKVTVELGSVSYTHLDVYKRQGRRRRGR